MAKFNQKIINRIMGKALYHLILNSVHPNGMAVIDKETNTHVVIFIDKDEKELKIQETQNIHPDNDCRISDIVSDEDLAASRTLN